MLSDQLLQDLLAFRKERDWEQFHNLRTLSTSIALEAAELMEHTQWATDADLPAIATERREAITEEIADIAILLTYLAHDLNVDIEDAVRRKLLKNAVKYPVEKARGCGDEVGSVVGVNVADLDLMNGQEIQFLMGERSGPHR
jgi:NTP pyrophosphatase (non-canonical NTP hydrolase)